MALYFLSYDLRKNKDYKSLYTELKNNFKAKRVLESTWCFKRVNTSSSNLRDHFKNYIDADDGIVVSEVSNWATFNTINTPEDL